jgi:hypothetical protein
LAGLKAADGLAIGAAFVAPKKPVVVLWRGFFRRLRQWMNRLPPKRRNIPMTRMDWGRRSRHAATKII